MKQIQNKLNLKPCPFCGNTAPELVTFMDESLWNHSIVPYYEVHCNGCDLISPRTCDDLDECVDFWNFRDYENQTPL